VPGSAQFRAGSAQALGASPWLSKYWITNDSRCPERVRSVIRQRRAELTFAVDA
jgi:hypothetical protein